MELSNKELKELKEKLLDLKNEIEEKLISFKETSKPVSLDDPIGRVSRIDAIQQQQVALDQRQKLEIKLKQVGSALKRIDNNEFGYCSICEEPIEKKRLYLQPETMICVQCKTTREK